MDISGDFTYGTSSPLHYQSSRNSWREILKRRRAGIENGDIPDWLKVFIMIISKAKGSRSSHNKKGKDPEILSDAVFRDIFGDSDEDKPADYAVHNQISEKNISRKNKRKCAKELRVGGAVLNEDSTSVVLHRPPANEDQSQPWTFVSHIMHHKGFKNSHFPEDILLLEDIHSQVLEPSYCVLPVPSILQCLLTRVESGVLKTYIVVRLPPCNIQDLLEMKKLRIRNH